MAGMMTVLNQTATNALSAPPWLPALPPHDWLSAAACLFCAKQPATKNNGRRSEGYLTHYGSYSLNKAWATSMENLMMLCLTFVWE